MNAPPSPAAPPAADWASRYRTLLENRLRWAVESLPPAGQPPTNLQPHLASLLTLLSEADQQLGPHPLSVQLTLGLHPWPLRWGMWPAWDSALRTAAQTAASLGLADQQAYLLTALAELQIARGVLPQALEFAVQALKIARTQRALPPFQQLLHRGDAVRAFLGTDCCRNGTRRCRFGVRGRSRTCPYRLGVRG